MSIDDRRLTLSESDRAQLDRVLAKTPFRHRRALLVALTALLVILLFSCVTLYLEVARQAHWAEISAWIAWRRLGMGAIRTGNLRLIRAVADFQIATMLLILVASGLFGFLYVDRLENLVAKLWRQVR
ncbi:MAG TPA: hypothetical protein VG777_03335 [Thermoanaerobaculia bacterium]|nr:hypothetical protein [Thermoanaerobaculia bacterium]